MLRCRFFSKDTYLFTGRKDSHWPVFQELLMQLQEVRYPIGAKELNWPVFKSFGQIKKLLALHS
jgi:hypothetical protein